MNGEQVVWISRWKLMASGGGILVQAGEKVISRGTLSSGSDRHWRWKIHG